MLTDSDRREIENIVANSLKPYITQIIEAVDKLKKSDDCIENLPIDLDEIQLKRCELVNKIFEEDSKDNLTKSFTQIEEWQNELKNMSLVIADPQAQECLDYFDFDEVVKVCDTMGYTYRHERITKKTLINDAIDLLNYLKGCHEDVCRRQVGRLHGNKYRRDDNKFSYQLLFEISEWETDDAE